MAKIMSLIHRLPGRGLRLLWSVLRVVVLRGAGIALSFLITMMVVERFGTSATADSLLVVRRLVVRLSDAGRTMTLNGLVPLFVRAAAVSDAITWRTMVRTRVYRFAAVGLVIASLISAFAGDIVGVIGAGFDALRQEQSTTMLRVFAFMLPSFLALGVLTAAGNARSLYGLPELVQLIPRLLALLALSLLPPTMSAQAVPWLYVLGSGVGAAVLVVLVAPGAHRAPDCTAERQKPPPMRVAHRIWAVTFTMIGAQLALWLQLYYASQTGPGAMTYLECSQTVMGVLPAVVMRSAASVAYVESARYNQDHDPHAAQLVSLRALVEHGLYLMLPIIIFIAVFAQEISELLFVRGQFTLQDAQFVAALIMAFSVGSVIAVVQNALNISILLDERLPLTRLAIEQVVVMGLSNLVLLAAFTPVLGVFAIPIAIAGSGLAVVVLRFTLIKAWWPVVPLILGGRRFRLTLTLSAGLLCLALGGRAMLVSDLDHLIMVAAMAGVVTVGASLYLVLGYLLRIWTPAMLRGRAP